MFLLGFYVAAVVKRWWEEFQWLAWPDDVMRLWRLSLCFANTVIQVTYKISVYSMVCFIMTKSDDHTMTQRRAIARYLNLSAALVYRDISVKVRKRFPKLEHIVASGLMSTSELQLFNSAPQNCRWFLPLQWVQTISYRS